MIVELAGLVVFSTATGWYVGRRPSLPEYMTPEADAPVRARVKQLRGRRTVTRPRMRHVSARA